MNIFIIISLLICFISAIGIAYNLNKIVYIDAKNRGIKRAKLWSFIAIGGQSSEGLLLYLINRRKYPSNIDVKDKERIDLYKRRLYIFLATIFVGFVLLIATAIFFK
ncbi:MAG: hypothetical protein WAO56_07565 [Miniphocaeibacter sp.]|uniref:hypothetical protein n=1 Tax=Miniphocaeibacter sp. TaxID=3100973 RepID=UPI00181C5C6B|nr:hypothetical protein [Gallicola sp.]